MNEVNAQNACEVARTVKGGAVVGPGTVRRSPSVGALATELAKAQAEMKNPPKDSVNPHFKSRYADLATVRDTVVPVLARHGLAVLQLPCEMDGEPALTTLLVHTSGEWVETTIKLRPGKSDPQGVGSALTYARRYALQAVAGVAAEDDDDGHAGSQRPQQQQQNRRPAVPANAALRGKYLERLGRVGARNEFEAVYRDYVSDLKAGLITPEDERALYPVFEAKGHEFPKPAAKA